MNAALLTFQCLMDAKPPQNSVHYQMISRLFLGQLSAQAACGRLWTMNCVSQCMIVLQYQKRDRQLYFSCMKTLPRSSTCSRQSVHRRLRGLAPCKDGLAGMSGPIKFLGEGADHGWCLAHGCVASRLGKSRELEHGDA